jgi:hypothetical protein
MRKAVLTTGLVAALAGLGAGCRPPPGTGVDVTNSVPQGSRVAPTPDAGRGAYATSPMPNVVGNSAVAAAPGPVALPPTAATRNRVDMMDAANPLLPTPSGRDGGTPYDVGAMGQLPPEPTQSAPIFRGLRQDF